MRAVRIALWLLAALAVGAFVYLKSRPLEPAVGAQAAPVGAPFRLVGADNQPFASEQLRGRPYALFFGFTHCPDVCPTTIARLVRQRALLGRGDRPFEIVFISVDPERDTPAELNRYGALFEGAVTMLTGTRAALASVEKSFGIYVRKVPAKDGDYSIDHTATVLLFDREGHFQATLAPDEGDAAVRAKLARLVA